MNCRATNYYYYYTCCRAAISSAATPATNYTTNIPSPSLGQTIPPLTSLVVVVGVETQRDLGILAVVAV